MPSLDSQVSLINQLLRQQAFSDPLYAHVQLYGIATDALRVDSDTSSSSYPTIYTTGGEGASMTIDDSYPLQLYHRIISKTYSPKKSSVGDRQNVITERTEMKLIIAGSTSLLSMTQLDVEAQIAMHFPDVVASSMIVPLGLLRMSVALQQSSLDSYAVWREEYKGIGPAISPTTILFSMRYVIESDHFRGC